MAPSVHHPCFAMFNIESQHFDQGDLSELDGQPYEPNLEIK